MPCSSAVLLYMLYFNVSFFLSFFSADVGANSNPGANSQDHFVFSEKNLMLTMSSMEGRQPLEAALARTQTHRSIMRERKTEKSMEKQQKRDGEIASSIVKQERVIE